MSESWNHDRRYFIRSPEGEYFRKWEPTDWETVKRVAVWTRNKAEAMVLTLREWEKQNYTEAIFGFRARLELIP